MSQNLPEHLKHQKQYLTCGIEGPRDVSSPDYAGVYESLDVPNDFLIEDFKRNLKIDIQHISDEMVVFDISSINVAIANALRRILIAEIPTIAIETVHIWQNTGVTQDETLAHRLGLIPFRINPDTIQYRKDKEELSEVNCVKFRLHVKCQESDVTESETSYPVYASALQWIPLSEKQSHKYHKNPPAPVYPDILITKLKPNQEIEAEVFVKKVLAKPMLNGPPSPLQFIVYSPTYVELYTTFKIFVAFPKGPLTGDDAKELKELCPKGVFDIENGQAIAPNFRECTTCRACIERFPDRVLLSKKKDHVIFTIESTGSIAAMELFLRAVKILKQKALNVKVNLASKLESE